MTIKLPDIAVEASDLGWKPGYRPNVISHLGRIFALDSALRDGEQELIAWVFLADDGTKLTVYND